MHQLRYGAGFYYVHVVQTIRLMAMAAQILTCAPLMVADDLISEKTVS